jgi:hypothetical protein
MRETVNLLHAEAAAIRKDARKTLAARSAQIDCQHLDFHRLSLIKRMTQFITVRGQPQPPENFPLPSAGRNAIITVI